MAEQDIISNTAAKTVREKSNAGHIKTNDLKIVTSPNPSQEHGHQTNDTEASTILAEYSETFPNIYQTEPLASQDILEKCLSTLYALRLERDYVPQNQSLISTYSDKHHGAYDRLMVMHKELTHNYREDESTAAFWAEEESLRENANLALEDILTALSAQNGPSSSGTDGSAQPDLTPDRD